MDLSVQYPPSAPGAAGGKGWTDREISNASAAPQQRTLQAWRGGSGGGAGGTEQDVIGDDDAITEVRGRPADGSHDLYMKDFFFSASHQAP